MAEAFRDKKLSKLFRILRPQRFMGIRRHAKRGFAPTERAVSFLFFWKNQPTRNANLGFVRRSLATESHLLGAVPALLLKGTT
jgi:hypothetical protein